jgi:hypothetical protein
MANISVQGDTSTHGGAPLNLGLSADVSAGNKGVALSGQSTSTANDDQYNANRRAHPQGVAGNQKANAGSGTVFANNKAVHRVGDARIDGATSGPGISSVNVG